MHRWRGGNALPLLCDLVGTHACTEVRYNAVTALHDFLLCPQELVEPVISAYASGPHGSNVSPVIATLMQKCCPHGDIALKVREKACFGVLNRH